VTAIERDRIGPDRAQAEQMVDRINMIHVVVSADDVAQFLGAGAHQAIVFCPPNTRPVVARKGSVASMPLVHWPLPPQEK